MDSNALARQISDYDSKRVTSADAMNEALAQYGIPEIRKTVSGMRTTIANTSNALNAVDPSVTGRTQGSLVTEAQRQKQVANERQPIAQQLDSQGKALGDSERVLNESLGQATQLATNRVNDWNTGRQALQSQYDTTYKREQDTLAVQLAREQAARQQAENDRQFALAQQQARSSGGSSSSAASRPASGADRTKADYAAIGTALARVRGGDGYVSPASYAAAKKDFVSAGYSAQEFDNQWSNLRNPKNKNYKLG